MQRIGANGKQKIIFFAIIPIILLGLFLAFDQLTKKYFADNRLMDGISGIFRFYYTENTGSAFSFLGDKSWGQLFFKILTPIALVLFLVLYVFAYRRSYKILTLSLTMMISGTIGNYIDRLVFSFVRDFIKLDFMNFPIFNVADILLCVGVGLFIVHYLFLDKNAFFKKENGKENSK